MSLEVIISTISAIVAIIAAIFSYSQARSSERSAKASEQSAKAAEEQVRIANEALELQKKKEEQEVIKSKKANIVLKRDKQKLIIENKGDAPASNVRLTVLKGNQEAFSYLKDSYYVPENDSFSKDLLLDKTCQPPWTIKITWDDEYQKGNEKTQQLN